MSTILFIATNEWAWGGSEILWSEAAERLARAGADVRVSFQGVGKPKEPMKRIRAAGGKVHLRQPPTRSLVSRALRRIVRGPAYIDHVRRIGGGVDLVVICYSSFPEVLPWMEAVRSAGLRYVIVVQGASTGWWPDDPVAERLGTGFDTAVRTYFVSQATLDLCRLQFGARLCNGQVIRNPFNVRYDAQVPWPGDVLECLELACVGRLEVGTKGQDILLEALSRPHWRERSVRVTFVGGGPHERLLKGRTEELRLTNVRFVGHQEDVEAVWANHHALILPSRQEGMPLVVVEAMLCGRACIATDVGGNRELIRDGVNGFLAKGPMVEFLDEAMNCAWENRERLRQMGEQAAVDARIFVSADPVGDFVAKLEGLVTKRQLVTA